MDNLVRVSIDEGFAQDHLIDLLYMAPFEVDYADGSEVPSNPLRYELFAI